MYIHVKIHRWVLWWFYIGIVCGVIAVVNILTRNLTRLQDHVILIVGAVHWALGGVVCWAFDGVRIHEAPPPSTQTDGKRPRWKASGMAPWIGLRNARPAENPAAAALLKGSYSR